MIVHFIGIGGIGMSALARYYKNNENCAVSGSDIADSKLIQELKKEGIKVHIGHGKKNVPKKCDLAVYNQAIRENNPELTYIKKFSIPLLSYPEAVGEITKRRKTVAIAGSHGKSTTTALMSLILTNAGFDPTVIVGTRMKEFGNRNFRAGNSYEVQPRKLTRLNLVKWLVLESDEYGRAFHHYSPFAALITNIDKEHLDTYKNLAGVKKSFLKFIENIQNGGILVLNSKDKNLASLREEILTIAKRKKLKVYWYDRNTHIASLASLGLLPSLLGDHNISNASGAYVLSRALGIDDQTVFNTLKSFSGTWRRLEYRGDLELRTKNEEQENFLENKSEILHHTSKIAVYDDYAHHPTEIRASLAALRQTAGQLSRQRRGSPEAAVVNGQLFLICVFQPHQTERLERLFNEFVDAFRDADAVILLDVYQVAGRERLVTRINNLESSNISSKELANQIKKKYPEKEVLYLKNPKTLPKLLASRFYFLDSGVIVLMGAGDIVRYTDLLLTPHL